jgi:hypothetical protein
MSLRIIIRVPFVCLSGSEPLSCILDQSDALTDSLSGECTQALNHRGADFEHLED